MTAQLEQLDAEVREALATSLHREIASVRAKPCIYHTSHVMRQLDVTLTDGTKLALMFKDCGPAGWFDAAKRVKPAFLYDPRREIEVYRDVLAKNLGAPTFYGHTIDEPNQRYWLFIENVRATPLWQFHK